MKKRSILSLLTLIMVISLITALLTGCGSSSDTGSSASSASTVSAVNTSSIQEDDMFTKRDLDPSYDESTASKITFDNDSVSMEGDGVSADGSVVTITAEGTYILSGTSADGQVIVSANDTSKVQLVLDDLTLTNDDSACILVENADKVFITLADGSDNTLSDTGTEYTQSLEDTTVDGVIFSKDTLTLNGTGTLNVNANYDNGIVSKDDLKITSGTYNITSTGKALEGKDSIRIKSGNITITSQDDALHSDNEEDGKGFIYIENGTLTISTKDDGIHAQNAISIVGGTINIEQSYEGIEAQQIDVNGGTIHVVASDDGINASDGSGSGQEGFFGGMNGMNRDTTTSATQESTNYSSLASAEVIEDSDSDAMARGGMGGGMGGGMMDTDENAYLRITGGDLTVNANGDGLDTNGYLYIDGGNITVYGPTNSGNGAVDYGLGATITGGTVMIAGSAGMAETFGSDSTQYSIMTTFDSVISAGTEVTLTDSSGNVVLQFTPEKDYQNVILSSPSLAEGSYTLTAGSVSKEITVSSITTTVGSGNTMGGMMNGGMQNSGSGSAFGVHQMPQGGMTPPDQNGGMSSGNSGFNGNGSMTPPGQNAAAAY